MRVVSALSCINVLATQRKIKLIPLIYNCLSASDVIWRIRIHMGSLTIDAISTPKQYKRQTCASLITKPWYIWEVNYMDLSITLIYKKTRVYSWAEMYHTIKLSSPHTSGMRIPYNELEAFPCRQRISTCESQRRTQIILCNRCLSSESQISVSEKTSE